MPPLDARPLDDQIFALLAITISGLFLVAVLFSLVTLTLRRKHTRVALLWARLEGKWDPVILEVLAGEEEPDSLLRLVAPGEELRFLDYLLRYSRRLRGEETAVLKTLSRPFLHALGREVGNGGAERRGRAIQTLGVLGMPERVDLILEALDDPSPLVSMIAAQSLAKPDYPEHLPLLLDRLHRYADWHPAFLAGLLSDSGSEAGPLLRSALADEARPEWSRAIIAHALQGIRDLDAADVAVEVVGPVEDPDLLVACLRLLAEVGESRHRGALLPLLASPHFPVRSNALRALRAVGSEKDLPEFTKALKDDSPWVALEAARGLRELGGMEVLERMALSEGPRSTLARQVISE